MNFELISKETAVRYIAQIGNDGKPFDIYVGEDICFGLDVWVPIGTLALRPSKAISSMELPYDSACAVRFGGYEWELPTQETLAEDIRKALACLDDSIVKKTCKFFFQGFQDALRRVLLLYPIFDASAIVQMPLRKPMTVVADTSAVHQGGLDFVCRFLTPAARIKIPAIVHMEVVEQSDNYFKKIRFNIDAWSNKKTRADLSSATLRDTYRPSALDRHLLSQGGQRTLLRIEFNPDVDIERGDLASDPLRGIVMPESDPEDKNLGITRVVKGFADRLILETARRIQTQVRPNHPLALLTSDQGMARMALAEGIDAFFFQTRSIPNISGRKLTGTLFHPFGQGLVSIPLTEVLWELAVSFGCLRLYNRESEASLELWAIGSEEERTPGTDEIREDLLRGKFEPGNTLPGIHVMAEASIKGEPAQEINDDNSETESSHSNSVQILPSYIFTPNGLLDLIGALIRKGTLTSEEARIIVGVKTEDKYKRYERFLQSGNFLIIKDNHLLPTEALNLFWEAIIQRKTPSILEGLRRVPSFEGLYTYILSKRVVSEDDPGIPIRGYSKPNYFSLGEVACAWMIIPEKGILATDTNIAVAEFVPLAIQVYEMLRAQNDSERILTGAWLEEMALQYAIHPITSKMLLEEARRQELLNVYAEGSTPDTRFEKHRMWVLEIVNGNPQLVRCFLYHGDFLMPGIASVRIEIEGIHHAT